MISAGQTVSQMFLHKQVVETIEFRAIRHFGERVLGRSFIQRLNSLFE